MVRPLVRCNEAGAIDAILRLLHDRWFWFSAIFLDPELPILKVPFEESSGALDIPAGEREVILEIHHVSRFELHDDAEIDRYDLNTISFDEHSQVVRLETGFPAAIHVEVKALDLRVVPLR